MQGREMWSSNIGFILACVGSAVGLGNIWRFPYIVGTNGGGAFLVPYVIITIGFGLTFMVLEFAVGRYYKTSVISSLVSIGKKFKWAGVVMVTVSFAILSYYMVILGWILSYVILIVFDNNLDFETFTNSWYPVVSFLVVLGFNYWIIRRGVSKGIERLSKIGIVLLVAMLVPLAIIGMLLPGSDKGIEFYLTPDFEKLSEPTIWSTAFGQVFFSLSVGAGILLTYGSYLQQRGSLLKSSATIIIFNTLVSFVAGLMIFSIVFAFGMNPTEGTSLVFKVLPSIFSVMEFGTIIGMAFFILLLIAGLTSSVSLFQVPVSALEDTFEFSKSKAAALITLLLFVIGLFSALSYSPAKLSIMDTPFLDFMDTFFGTYGLSISAIVFIIVVTWFMDRKKILEQVNLNSRVKMPPATITVAKYVFPGIIIASILVTAITG